MKVGNTTMSDTKPVKMKMVKLILIGLFSFCLCQTLSAKELKLGVVDIARVLEESPQATAARDALQKEFTPREQRLVETQKKIVSMEEQLGRDAAIMSEAERSKLERNILSKKRDFKRNQDEFRDDLNFKRNEILEKLQRDLVGSIREYAKAEGFDILFAEGVIYADDSLNITEQMLKKLKK